MENANSSVVRPSGVCTETVALPTAAIKDAGMLASTSVDETSFVATATPFHKTTLPSTKLVPLAISVMPALPATTLFGLMEASVAGWGASDVMERGNVLDNTPPGFVTPMFAVPALATRDAGIFASTSVAETKVEVTTVPFHVTWLPLTKLLPEATSVKPALPATTLLGLIDVNVGARATGEATTNDSLFDEELSGFTAPTAAVAGEARRLSETVA